MLSNSFVEKDRAHFIHPVAPLRADDARGVTVTRLLRDDATARGVPAKTTAIRLETGYHGSTLTMARLPALPECYDLLDRPALWRHHHPSSDVIMVLVQGSGERGVCIRHGARCRDRPCPAALHQRSQG